MLVLTRKLQQQIKIGEQITVTILRVKGNTVRVGITAPREVRVIRGELPKNGAAAESEQLTVDAVAVAEESRIETEETADDSAGPAVGGSHVPAATLPIAAHLPLRKIANRHGNAPLKRIVAACSTLAK
jgi:carbon storage regulator CsrA